MNTRLKHFLRNGAAVLGLVAVAGGVYYFSSTGMGLQADILSQTATVPVVDANSNVAVEGDQAVSGIFDATPTAGASLPEISTGMTMSGLTMSGIVLPTVTTTVVTSMASEVEALEGLRPAASEQASTLINALGFSNDNANGNTNGNSNLNNNQNSSVQVAPVVTSSNANANVALAVTALQSAPRVPQTGAETWLLSASILFAMMGMTMLLTSPKHL